MDSDEESEIFSYTPLKRKKIRGNCSISSSQPQKKQYFGELASSRKKLKQNNTQSKLNSSHNQRGKSSFKLSDATDFSVQKSIGMVKQNKPNHYSYCTKTKVTIVPLRKKIEKEKNRSRSTSSKVNSSTDFQLNSTSDDSQLPANDSDIPDIDFTQIGLNNNVTSKDYSSKHSYSESTCSFEGVISKSILDERPIDVEAIDAYRDTNKKKPTGRPKKQGHETPLSGDEFQVTSCNIDKVDSWLKNSLEFLTPRKIEVIENFSNDSKNTECSKDHLARNLPNASENQVEAPKACIHLHFHVNSPKKLIQPTLENFFKNSSVKCKNRSPGKPKNSGPSTSNCNSKDVIKRWENIMNTLKTGASNKEASRSITEVNGNINSASNSGVANRGIMDSTARASTSDAYKNKVCPFYKYVEDTSFVVDAFSYGIISGVSAYFLSHFHYDHYRGLNKHFSKNIYCSHITANLVRFKIKVPDKYLRILPLEEPTIINGVEVTLYDANHCPGSVMFLFKLSTGKTILHVGDFRANSNMETISDFWNKPLDVLYLDTTYLDSRYDFPSQQEILEKCVNVSREHAETNENVVFVVGSYLIGKEKVFKAIANELDCKIYAATPKLNVLQLLEDPEISDRLTKNKFEAKVHVVSMSELTPFKLKKYMDSMLPRFKVLVGIKPTGWTHSNLTSDDLENLRPQQMGNVYLYGVPYSEHSSYFELQRFVQFAQSRKIIPTVNNGNPNLRKKMQYILDRWRVESNRNFRRTKR